MGKILATVRLCLIIIVMAVMVFFGVIFVKLGIIKMDTVFYLRSVYCKIACFILGIRLHVSGEFIDEANAVYMGNHRSLLDPLVVFTFIKNGYAVSKAEVASYPLINTAAKFSGVVFVDRNSHESRRSTKEKIIELLQDKKSVVIFPEGTISTLRTTLPFRKGSIEAAVATKKPIHYFALELGNPDRDFWYKEGLLEQFVHTFSKWRTDVYIHHFPPLRSDDVNAALLKIETDINKAMVEFQRNWKEKQKLEVRS